MKKHYTVTWGEGQTQKCNTKSEAIKIASELLNTYTNVFIKKWGK